MLDTNIIQSFVTLFERDLIKLEQEISSYPDEASIWKIEGDIKNSAGNLALHLCGNLQHYIGREFGETDYKRDRPYEFAARNVPKDKLLAEIKTTRQAVTDALNKMDPSVLDREYPT